MAQSRSTHKGDRAQIMVPIAAAVYAELDRRAAHHRTSISQLSADLLAITTGHPTLARELHKAELLSLTTTSPPVNHVDQNMIRRTNFRIPRPVYADIRQRAAAHATDAGQIAADLLAISTGHHGAVRLLDRNREVLPLAM